MKYKKITDNGKMPVIGLGTWEVGGHRSADYSQDDEIVEAFQAALQLGYTHIDTAEMYGGGHTEELVGQAIRGVKRQDLFITSKVWHTNLHYQDVLNAAAGSLKRLGTDYLDLYLIHWPNDRVPLEETFKALNELVERGQARRLGVSNFNLGQLKQARQLSQTMLVCNQVPYSLFHREYVNNGVLEYCQENGILVTAYTPIEKGRVANNADLKQIAEKYAATPVQVALSWLVNQPQVITIPMSTNKKHLAENLGAADLELSEEDTQRLDQLR
jgi:diketogulonate reductase-like aldo/keto reductase